MKLFLFTLAFLCCSTQLFSQTDEINLEKYWKFRNDFVQKFIKIGPNQGESLPAGSIEPLGCFDNDSDPNNYAEYGKMQWGDGMIRHGFYLRLLATEYALKKKYGQDPQGTLNELYYALYAINRLDRDAEPSLDNIYGINGFYQPTLNGFYLREDVYEDFCLNWETDQLNPRCTNSAFYENNNYAKVNDPANGLVTKPDPSHRNSPSLDQMTSLLVGLALVNKLVDDIYVESIPAGQGFYLVTETKDIVNRIVHYAADNNWELIDVNGWPCPNGGGDILPTAYPIMKAAARITGDPTFTYNQTAKRRVSYYMAGGNFNKIQHCITGFGILGGTELQTEQCLAINWNLNNTEVYNNLVTGQFVGPLNNQNNSIYQSWSFTSPYQVNIGASSFFWENQAVNNTGTALQNAENGSFMNLLANVDIPSHYNRTIILNLGVAAGFWNNGTMNIFGDITDNRELELTNALLNDFTPSESQSFYGNYLNSMSPEGPYDVEGWGLSNVDTVHAQSFQPNGWASTYRWVNPNAAYGGNQEKGIYNALNYMVFHNLYFLLFGDEISQNFEESYECFCSPQIQLAIPNPQQGQAALDAVDDINKKLKYVPTCQPNVFEPVFNLVTVTGGPFDVKPKFSDYADLEIATAKFQTMNATIANGGIVNTYSKLIVCNSKTLLVQDGGNLNAIKDDIRVKEGAAINLYGNITIEAGNELLIRSGGKLVMRSGSTLTINEGGRFHLEDGAILEYYDGATIESFGENAEFVLEGTVKMMNGGVFEIDHSGSPNSGRFILGNAGQKFITDYLAPEFAEVHLYGKDVNDEFLIIREGSKLHINHNESTNIDKLIIHSCLVKLEENTSIQSEKHFNTYNATYFSESVNEGVSVSAYNKFSACEFKNVPIYANLQFSESQKLIMISCNMVNEVGINDAHEAMVALDGIGMIVNNCTFLGSNLVLVKSKNMLFPSQISGSTFNQNTPLGQTVVTFGLQDYSNTELKLIECSFDGMRVGAYKNEGDLTLRCNTFDNSQIYDVAGVYGSIVNASANDYGGYNYFNSSSTVNNSSNIYVNYAEVNLVNGKNKFNSNAGYHIHGRLNHPCGINTDCSIFAQNNQWNTGLQIPPQSKFNVIGDDNLPFLVTAILTQLIPSCGSDDPTGPFTEIISGNSGTGQSQGQNNGNGVGPGSNNGNGNGNSPFSNNNSLPFIGTSFGSNIRLDHAVAYGREKMKPNNPNGDDEQAIDIFDEIFNVNIPKNSRQVKDWLNGSISDMKTSLENEIYEQRIASQLGQSGIEFYINEYLDALNYMTDSTIVDSNYTESFYSELDKAHLYRILGDPTSGLEIITKTETCGLDKEEQGILNYWKREYELDIKIDQLEMSYLDTVVLIDTSLYITPVVYNPPQFYFGTRFITLNDREYPTCTNGARLIGEGYVQASVGFSVYPNPASSRISIEFKEFKEYTNVQVVFFTSDGRIIEQLGLDSKSSITEHSVIDWNPGIYFYELIIDENKVSMGKLIVQ